MDYKNLIVEKSDKICKISFNRPKALNALNTEVLEELDKLLDEIEKDDETFVVVFTGEGKAFVAGADIGEMKDKNLIEGKKFAQLGHKVFRKIELLEKPVIAAVNGYALGGGCELAMSCDIRIAGEKAKFGQPEVGLGITPGFGGTQRLSRLVGSAKAKELIFTADTISAQEAEKIGLVNKVVSQEELISETMNMANKIATKGQVAVRFSKNAINRGIETDIDTALDIEINLFGMCFATEDQKEGMKAFTEKRKAEFKNK
ncbi:MAG: short-chain-enoyl-CoA hydratase [Tissierellales bacterium]|jgi:enoyl-CoA hydratase|nr:short-chain-enoyl-CoA hydratase [Tissierellales bacterium]